MSFADFKLIGLNRFPTSLYMWGDNTNGLLGDNRTLNYFSWSKISSGGLHTVAIRSDGLLFAWGRNTEGQIGDGTTIHRSSPVQLSATISWNSVSAGLSHTLAIQGDTTLWGWGANRYGQTGDGTTINRSNPVQLLGNYTSVTAGGNHSGAINTLGNLVTWGLNNSGQLGNNTILNRTGPGISTTTSFSGALGTQLITASNSRFATGTNDFTVELWVYPISASQGFTGFISSVDTTVGFAIMDTQAGVYTSGGGGGSVGINFLTNPPNNAWSHVALTLQSGTLRLFRNGVFQGSASLGALSVTTQFVAFPARYANLNYPLQGYLSNVRIVSGQALYTATFTPSTTLLTTTTVGGTGAGAATSLTGTVTLLACQDANFTTDYSNTPVAITAQGTAGTITAASFSSPLADAVGIGPFNAVSGYQAK